MVLARALFVGLGLLQLATLATAYPETCTICVWNQNKNCNARDDLAWIDPACTPLTYQDPCKAVCPQERGLSASCLLCVFNKLSTCNARVEGLWDFPCYVLADTSDCSSTCYLPPTPAPTPYPVRPTFAPTAAPTYTKCDPPAPISNGVADCTSKKCTWTCDFGYQLVGASSVTCSGVQWSAPTPECMAGCPLALRSSLEGVGGVELIIGGNAAYFKGIPPPPGCYYNGIILRQEENTVMTLAGTDIKLSYQSVGIKAQNGLSVTLTAREIPQNSCSATSCRAGTWIAGAGGEQCNTTPLSAGVCTCDDTCTSAGTCCADFMETCVLPLAGVSGYKADTGILTASFGNCGVTPANMLQDRGGVEVVQGTGSPVYLSTIPLSGCTYAGIRFSLFNNANKWRVTAKATGSTVDVVLTFSKISIITSDGIEVRVREIPNKSCVAQGCVSYPAGTQWRTSEGNLCNTKPSTASPGACYCDEGCTQLHDCCADYLETCTLAARKTGGFPSYAGVKPYVPQAPQCTMVQPLFLESKGGVEVSLNSGPKLYFMVPNSGCQYQGATFKKAGRDVTMTVNLATVTLTWMRFATTTTTPATATLWARKIPVRSCVATKCVFYPRELQWIEQTKNGLLSQCNMFPAAYVADACYCDDACTQYKDCCADYMDTCVSAARINVNNDQNFVADLGAQFSGGASCQVVAKQQLENLGGVEISIGGGAAQYLSQIPDTGCTFAGFTFAKSLPPGGVQKRITVSFGGQTDSYLGFMSTTIQVSGTSVKLREIPFKSCAATKCISYKDSGGQWVDGPVAKPAVVAGTTVISPAIFAQCNTKPEAFVMGSCYCDDACTQYKDCCADYMETCFLQYTLEVGTFMGAFK